MYSIMSHPNENIVSVPSFWDNVSSARSPASRLTDSIRAEITIIGGGFTGLSTALALAKAGKKVAVLEGCVIGWGASGRNNGQVIPVLSAAEPDAIEQRFGETGERLVHLIRDSAEYTFDLAKKENIECEAEQTGWFQPAHTPDHIRISQQRHKAWAKRGAPCRMVDRNESVKMLGSDKWYGGMFNPTGGHINPLAYARGLASACEAVGVQIFENTPATDVTRSGDGWIVHSENGEVTSDAVMLATHAYSDAIRPQLSPIIARTTIPVNAWQVASEPLSEDLRKYIVPGRQAVSDTRGDLQYFRYDARNRLISGGAMIFQQNAQERMKSIIGKRFTDNFPALKDLRFSHVWSGYVGRTVDGFPHFHQLGPDYWAWTGGNGRAVALSIALGPKLAKAITGTSQKDLSLPVTEITQIPMHFIARRVARLALVWFRWRDGQPPKIN